MNTEIAPTHKRKIPSVEIDADLAEILELLSSMVSSVGEIEEYFENFSNGIQLFSGVKNVYVWQLLQRGDDVIHILLNNENHVEGGASHLINHSFINNLATSTDPRKIKSISDLKAKREIQNQVGSETSWDTYITFPILYQKQMLGLVMLIDENEIDLSALQIDGIEKLASASGVFLHNAILLNDVSTLFHDLDFMIQEWIKDVSGRLEKVQQSESLLGKILSDLSHEFRTPIASLNLYSGLIQKRPENQKRYLETMQVELSRLEQILEGVLELSEFNVFSSKNQLQPIQVFSFFERYKNHLNSALKNFDVQLNYELEPCSSLIMANEEYLFRALLQLVINSAKYGNGSDINVVTMVGEEGSVEGQNLIIRVVDKGLGISTNDSPHIFNPFYRGEGVGQSTIFGVGLGLTFAREIIQFFGGTLSLAETSDLGTTMEIKLPLLTAQ